MSIAYDKSTCAGMVDMPVVVAAQLEGAIGHVQGIAKSIDNFDFELTADEMAVVSAHDMDYAGRRAKHFEPDFVRMVLGKQQLHGHAQ